MSLKDWLADKLRIPWDADGEKPAAAVDPHPETMSPSHFPPDMSPARGGLLAKPLAAVMGIVKELTNPSEPGSRVATAAAIDVARSEGTGRAPFGSFNYAGDQRQKERAPDVMNDPAPAYPMTRSRQDQGFRGSGENERLTTPGIVRDPQGRW